MSENGILANIFRMGDQVKRNLRDFVGNPGDYLDNIAHQNNIEWKKDPIERSMGFFNPVPLGNVSPFMLRKQMKEAIDEIPSLSRRDFMKKSGGIAAGTAAASIPGAKLLQKFAPEERAAVKQATVEAAPKYKYNSLKEYLDDVETSVYSKYDEPWFDEVNDLTARQQIQQRLLADENKYAQAKDYKGWAGHPEMDPMPKEELVKLHQTLDEHINKFSPQAKKEMKEYKELLRERLLKDEEAYNTSKFFYKDNLKGSSPGEWIDPFTGQPHSEEFLKNIRNTTDDFSPQAKQEMKEFKSWADVAYDGDWALGATKEFPR